MRDTVLIVGLISLAVCGGAFLYEQYLLSAIFAAVAIAMTKIGQRMI